MGGGHGLPGPGPHSPRAGLRARETKGGIRGNESAKPGLLSSWSLEVATIVNHHTNHSKIHPQSRKVGGQAGCWGWGGVEGRG